MTRAWALSLIKNIAMTKASADLFISVAKANETKNIFNFVL